MANNCNSNMEKIILILSALLTPLVSYSQHTLRIKLDSVYVARNETQIQENDLDSLYLSNDIYKLEPLKKGVSYRFSIGSVINVGKHSNVKILNANALFPANGKYYLKIILLNTEDLFCLCYSDSCEVGKLSSCIGFWSPHSGEATCNYAVVRRIRRKCN